MKMKSIFAWVLAVGMLSSCSDNDGDYNGPDIPDGAVAYLSVKIAPETLTRASGEQDGSVIESEIKSIYLLTFDEDDELLSIPGTTDCFIKLTTSDFTTTGNVISPEAQKISAKTEGLLVIANPGVKLERAITNTYSGSTLATVNAAITGIEVDELTDASRGFTMINSATIVEDPDDIETSTGDAVSPGDKISSPLVDVTDFLEFVEDHSSEEDAKTAAENNRVKLTIERLATKVEFKVASGSGLTVKPTDTNAFFELINWTLDAVNSTFYPFAEKTILSVTHNNKQYYINNFYTEDPNFNDNDGIEYTEIDDDYQPVLPHAYTWTADASALYSVENTMAAPEQKYENATRVVIKATYYPKDDWAQEGGDWFSFAGTNYESLEKLQTAYDEAGPGSNLQDACDRMYSDIEAYAIAKNITLIGSDFETLKPSDLDQLLPVGGEVVKTTDRDQQTGKVIPCIRWYQRGLNYYYYEIRHDDETTIQMDFGKYGVVRNNFYSLTLTSVSGSGTPWYPDINEPGPGDPDPTDPIDEDAAYLGIEIKVAPWIFWNRNIGI